ncbi:hypothetical protein AcW1_009699 [Taiwanofungus camphoratus]|nr:hypothetical protein AcV5_002402 [Antrodia cinnamomea]KAI0948100.1 hypothetical protein AcW1_009699 [Antrodia cinnamomea]
MDSMSSLSTGCEQLKLGFSYSSACQYYTIVVLKSGPFCVIMNILHILTSLGVAFATLDALAAPISGRQLAALLERSNMLDLRSHPIDIDDLFGGTMSVDLGEVMNPSSIVTELGLNDDIP